MEVQERPVLAVEDSRSFLYEPFDASEILEKWLETFQGLFSCMLHVKSI